jgi:protein-L-isoaspartate O-methyltransferase
MPRHDFLPDAVWAWDPDAQSQVRIDRSVEPDRWLEQVYRDEPVVTQWDGRPDGALGTVATSSSPRPSVVVRTLAELNPTEGMQVCHIGTGTGWTPAMINHLTGPGTVISMEIDPTVAESAKQRLRRAGSDVMVLPGETPHALHLNLRYDRLLYSFSRDRITPDVFDLVNDGAVVLAPWSGPWLRFGIAKLTVRNDVAQGHFLPFGSYAADRSVNAPWPLAADLDPACGEATATRWDPWQELTCKREARFAMGLRLADVAYRHDKPFDGHEEALWLTSRDGTSWAHISRGSDDLGAIRRVRQGGPRRLWDELDDAWHWWLDQRRPGPDRFGVTADRGHQHVWLDSPDRPVLRSRHGFSPSSSRSPSPKAI